MRVINSVIPFQLWQLVNSSPHLSGFVDVFGDPLGYQDFFQVSLWNKSMRITSNNLYEELYQT